MKILFVSATLPPEGTATGGIIGNIMMEMKIRGEDVSGLTFKNHISDKDISTWNDITINHANYVREYNFNNNDVSDIIFKLKRKLKDMTSKSKADLYRDMAVESLEEKLIELEADKNYDIIVAVAAFYDSVEAVRRYKKKLYNQARAKYVFYQVDPLRENIAYQSINATWLEDYEKEIYSTADCVFTTKIIYQIKKNNHWPISRVIPVDYPCVDLKLSECVSSIKKDTQEIRCVYAGSLNKQIRDATNFLKIISEIKNPHISFYFIGSGQESLLRYYSERNLKGRIHILGNMPIDECMNWLLSADILVVIGNNIVNQVPSKIFTYMSYGLPILATCKSLKCTSRKYLMDVPNALILDEFAQEKCIKEKAMLVEKFIMNYSGSRLTSNQIEKYAYKYTPEKIVEVFISTFKNI